MDKVDASIRKNRSAFDITIARVMDPSGHRECQTRALRPYNIRGGKKKKKKHKILHFLINIASLK